MASRHSKRAKITSRGNEGPKGLIEERDGTNDVTREILAKWLPMDQIDTTNSNASRINECSQPSEHGHKFDVFLSHSGKQKNFVRQLHRDLTNQGVSCFFDQDCESLPAGEHFPSRIFEAAKTCKVAVLLLSKDFLETKWPMRELSAFVKARVTTNPELKILPLFFGISPDALKNTKENDEKWDQLEISREQRAEWRQALKAIGSIKGLPFGESGDEVKFRDEIVKEIWRILPTPSPRYHVRGMQGEARMCQEVANFFNKVQPNEKGIRIAGLYGIAGHGKSTLGKAFCNFKLGGFEGKVCHLEVSRADPFERTKLALHHLTHRPQSYVRTLTSQDQAQEDLYTRAENKRVLLVLDNVTEESIDEVTYYLKVNWGEESCILLSARSVDVLVKQFNINSRSCMRVPTLEEEEAIAILLERTFQGESKLGEENRGLALKCTKRCLFKETFHPLALKAFGSHLFSKYGSNLSKWVDEINCLVDRPGYGLDDLFAVLGKTFDAMYPKYRTIFMLLTVYMLPKISGSNVTEWMAINCNEDISFIVKAIEDLKQKAFIEEIESRAFIEEIEPEIRIHDLYIEFAQSKANKMERWLGWKGIGDSTRGLISEDDAGFELAKLEQCVYQRIAPKYLRKLRVLQLVDVDGKNMSKIDLGPMDRLRSITLRNCKFLAALDGMEKLLDLAWLEIREVNPLFKIPELRSLICLQHLEIDIADSVGLSQLGDLTDCSRLREIYVRCPSLSEFPRVNGLKYLKKVEFSLCDKVTGPLDCTECVELQSIVLDRCSQMAASPLLAGCKKLSKIVLQECDAVIACPDVTSALKTVELFASSKTASPPKNLESCNELENLQLRIMAELKELPSFTCLSNLTVLVLYECGVKEPPDFTCCVMLEDVYFCKLENLVSFPKFSLVRGLKKLRLYECKSVEASPDISGCDKLLVFHLVHNDNIKGLPKMGSCPVLQEIKLSWNSEDEVTDDDGKSLVGVLRYRDLQNLRGVSVAEALKELQWQKVNFMRVEKYWCGGKLYYSITAPYKLKMVLQLTIEDEKRKRKALKVVAAVEGVDSVAVDMKEKKMTVIGEADPVFVTARLRKYGFDFVDLQSVDPATEEKKEEKNPKNPPVVFYVQMPYYDNSFANEENPNACTIG